MAVLVTLQFGLSALLIVGVIRDFHYQSLREAIRPFVLAHRPEQVDYITVQIAAHDVPTTLDYLKTTWHPFLNGGPRRRRPNAA